MSLRNSDFLDSHDIDYQLGYEVKSIARDEKAVIMSDGSKIPYDNLLLATGGRARKPSNPGSDLKGVYLLRSGEDQLAIKAAAAKARSIVVVGGGFISSEVTANLGKAY